MHRRGADAKDHVWSLAALRDDLRRAHVRREVDVRAGPRHEAVAADRFDHALRSAVEEYLRRLARREAEVDIDRVPLARADARSVFGESEALLVAGRDDLRELFGGHVLAARQEPGKDVGDAREARGIQRQPERSRLVPQSECEQLAHANPARAVHRGQRSVYARAVRTATVAEVIALLEENLAREPGGAIAVDGDGTLWSGDIGEDFFEALLEDGNLSDATHTALAREAEAEKLDTSGGAVAIARRIHAGYLAGTFPEERVCEIMAWAFAGRTHGEVDAFAARVVAKIELHTRLHGEAIRIVAWARERGVATYLVSASPRAIVEQAARLVGIDLANVASATEERDASGVVQTSVVRPIPYGPGKVMHLRAKLGARPLYAALGDNAFDVAMLRESRIPVAIRPKPRLVERASEVPNLVTLERL